VGGGGVGEEVVPVLFCEEEALVGVHRGLLDPVM
jgi:hypothetical protein